MYIDIVKFLLKFDDTTLQDSISTQLMTVSGNQTVTILDDKMGYVMKQDQFLEGGDILLDIYKKMKIGFWLYPVSPGFVREEGTDNAKSVEMSLINIVSSSDINIRPVSINESTSTNDANFLTIKVEESGGNSYQASTSDYEIGMWHHFWIVYDNSNTNINVYIDGKLQTLKNITGSIPGNLNISTGDVFINKNIGGYDYYKTNNYGYIDNFIILNGDGSLTSEQYLQKIINYSVDYAFDDDFENLVEKNYGIIFNDPPIIKINSLVDDMAYVYVSRSDGSILRGSSLLWESRKIFSDEKEKSLLNETVIGKEKGNTENIEIVNGFLRIKNSIIEL